MSGRCCAFLRSEEQCHDPPAQVGAAWVFILALLSMSGARAEIPRPDVCDIEVWIDANFEGSHGRTQGAALPLLSPRPPARCFTI